MGCVVVSPLRALAVVCGRSLNLGPGGKGIGLRERALSADHATAETRGKRSGEIEGREWLLHREYRKAAVLRQSTASHSHTNQPNHDSTPSDSPLQSEEKTEGSMCHGEEEVVSVRKRPGGF